MTCVEFADQAAELALGTLEGHVRAAALIHAEGCPSCQALLQDLSLTADALFQLAPSAEPPLGFEDRFFAAIHAERPRRRWKLIAGVAIAAVLAAGVALGIGRVAGERAASRADLATATLRSGTRVQGEVVVARGQAVVTATDLGPITSVVCQVTLKDGRVLTVGSWGVSHGYASWTAPLNVEADDLRSAQLVGPDGQTIVTAPFSG